MTYDLTQLYSARKKIETFLKENRELFVDTDVDGFLIDDAIPHLTAEIEKISETHQEEFTRQSRREQS